MAGETDLAAMLTSLDVVRRPGSFVFVTGEWPALAEVAAATITEDEGRTHVVTVEQAEAAGAPTGPAFAWLTLTVHSSLEAVGLTGAVSGALAGVGIACNVIAGYHHDHLLVPEHRADRAIHTLTTLRTRPRETP